VFFSYTGPVVLNWTFAAVCAALGGAELARELVAANADGNLDALLVLRVCKVNKKQTKF
jgi:hypothetical protein